MPTSFTEKIYDGEQQSFRDFALRTSRGVGATITMRDQSLDTLPTPETVQNNSTYHAEKLLEANRRLDAATAMTDEEAEAKALQIYQNDVMSWQRRNVARHALRTRYNNMLAQVSVWQSPTKNHEPLKEFMISQLQESLEYDTPESPKPTRMTGQEYRQSEIDVAWRDIGYHTKRQVEQTLANYDRAEWVAALIASLPPEQV